MAELRVGRYCLLEQIPSSTAATALVGSAQLWRGRDEVLDRDVAIRVVDADDPRVPAFLAAARAAALVEDRRLLRVLDVLELTTLDDPQVGDPQVGDRQVSIVVSEWATGTTVDALLDPEHQSALSISQAAAITADVAQAIAAGLASDTCHGRLRPTSVIVTDIGEVRVRGLAVDAALFGPLGSGDALEGGRAWRAADVDGLGSLLALLTTGRWPGPPLPGLAETPTARGHVLLPSNLRADIPRAIDELVARSVRRAERPRGTTELTDAIAFAQALGVARDHLTSASTSAPVDERRRNISSRRLVTAAAAVGIAFVIGLLGWQLATGGEPAWQAATSDSVSDDVLRTEASAVPVESLSGVERVLPVTEARSYDPFGDDNGDGRPDRRRGQENEEAAPFVADGDETTAWESERYSDATAGGKSGVGVILDLGSPQPVRAAQLRFTETGAPVEIRVADEVLRDPQLWSLVAKAPAGDAQITLRSPRPITGRYVLLWFPELPQVPGSSSYQVSLGEARIIG